LDFLSFVSSLETRGKQRKPKENHRIHPAPDQRKPKESKGNQRNPKETKGNQRIPKEKNIIQEELVLAYFS